MHLLPDGTRALFRLGHGIANLQSVDEQLVSGRRDDELRRHANIRHVGPAAAEGVRTATRRQVMIFGGGNPATNTTEILDLSASPLQWTDRAADVAAAHRDERDDSSQRQGARHRRIDQRRRHRNGQPQRRSLRSGHEYVFIRRRNLYPRLYHSNSLLLPDATVLLLGGNPCARHLRIAHGDLLAGLSLQRGWLGRRTAVDHRRPGCRLPMAARSRFRRRMPPTSRRSR